MMKKEFWNDVASKGAILGAIMLASHLFEQMFILNGSLSRIAITGCEMLVAAIVYVWLLLRFTKGAARKFGDETLGFSYSRGLLYSVYVSMFAGIIVGLGGYLYIHYAVGYDNYIERMIEMYRSLMENAAVPASLGAMYENMFATLRTNAEPGVFDSIVSSVFGYILAGLVVGIFVAAAASREPKIFDDDKTESNE